jgi:DNA-binding NarL/FixJ family response regulator
MLSVLIADGHFIDRYGLKEMLREEFCDLTFGETATASEALVAVAKQYWALIVLDIGTSPESGFQVLAGILRQRPESRVVVLGTHSEPRYTARALHLGAFAYVTKVACRAEIIAAFRTVLAGRKYVSPSVTQRPDFRPEGGDDVSPAILSARERTVLLALVAGKRVNEIAIKLNLNEKTVTTYRRRILDKLQLHSTVDLIRYALDHQLS